MGDSPGDGVAFKKGTTTLAHMFGESSLGTFRSFEKMTVTSAGHRAGYVDLQCGQDVNTPHARTVHGSHVQLPVRQGIVHRIVLGSEKAGASQQSSTQQRLLCLSLVEKESIFAPGHTDAEGHCCSQLVGQEHFLLYNCDAEPRYCDLIFHANLENSRMEDGTVCDFFDHCPLMMRDFAWVFSSPQHVRGIEYLNAAKKGTLKKWLATGKYLTGRPFSPSMCEYKCITDFAEAEISSFAIPSVSTAAGQAKRSIPPRPACAVKRRRKSVESDSSSSDSDSNSDS